MALLEATSGKEDIPGCEGARPNHRDIAMALMRLPRASGKRAGAEPRALRTGRLVLQAIGRRRGRGGQPGRAVAAEVRAPGATAAEKAAVEVAPPPQAPSKTTVGHGQPSFAFRACPTDHCETDRRALRHLDVALRRLVVLLAPAGGGEGAAKGSAAGNHDCPLRIWDPYYCDGAAARHLRAIGFPNVVNRNEDFYAVAAEGRQPAHDVLVSNPPYSGDHIERCMKYCAASGKPWFLLLPNWVCDKPWYQQMCKAGGFPGAAPFFIGPVAKAYTFAMPRWAGRPAHVSDSGQTVPYLISWFVHVPKSRLYKDLFRFLEGAAVSQVEWAVASTSRELRDRAKDARRPMRQGFKLKA